MYYSYISPQNKHTLHPQIIWELRARDQDFENPEDHRRKKESSNLYVLLLLLYEYVSIQNKQRGTHC